MIRTIERPLSSPAYTISAQNLIWLLLFTVGFGCFFIGAPKLSDDIDFMRHMRSWLAPQGISNPQQTGDFFTYGIPWEELRKTYIWKYYTDNLRLGNCIGIILLLLPKWIGSGLTLMMLVWSVVLGMRISGINPRTSCALPMILCMWTLCLPWYNYFGSLIYQWNYVFPSWLGLLLYDNLDKVAHTEKGDGFARGLLCVVLAILLGWAHEGFSVPLTGALIVMLLLRPQWRNGVTILCIVCMIAEAAFLLSVPGMQLRSESQLYSDSIYLIRISLFGILKGAPFYLLVLAYMCVRTARRGIGWIVKSDFMTFFVSSSLATIGLIIVSRAAPRLTFWADISAILIVSHIAGEGGFRWLRMNRKTAAACAVCAGLLMTTALTFQAVFSLRYRYLVNQAVERYIATGEASLYAPSLFPGELSPWGDFYFNELATYYYWNYLNYNEDANPYGTTIIPEELIRVTGNEGELVGFGNGIRRIKHYFYMPVGDRDRKVTGLFNDMEIDKGSGYMPVLFFYSRYKSLQDGKDYYWMLPIMQFYPQNVKKIKSIRTATPASKQ